MASALGLTFPRGSVKGWMRVSGGPLGQVLDLERLWRTHRLSPQPGALFPGATLNSCVAASSGRLP